MTQLPVVNRTPAESDFKQAQIASCVTNFISLDADLGGLHPNSFFARKFLASQLYTLLFCTGLVLAGTTMASDDYLCTVHGVYDLSDAGKIVPPNESYDALMGQRFSVDRQTGTLAGDLTRPITARVIVVDPGSHEQSYKVIATSTQQFPYLDYLEVGEHIKNEEKPFFYRDRFFIRTGICHHL